MRDRVKVLSPFEFQMDVTLKQYGRPFFQDQCDFDSCFETSTTGPDYPVWALVISGCLSLPAPPPPPTNCAAASTGACLEVDGVDDDCCTGCGEGACASGYTYAGQFVFDKELLASTYPDFYSLCNIDTSCGNTCCVPVDTNETARVAAGG